MTTPVPDGETTPELDGALSAARRKLGMYVDEHDDDEIKALLAEYDRRGAVEARYVEQVMRVLPYVPGPDPDDQSEDFDERVVAELHGRAVELVRLRAQRDAVLALHQREEWGDDGLDGIRVVCGWCRDSSEEPWEWPCPTARALGVES